MVGCYPSTPKKMAMTVGLFVSGALLFVGGLQICHANVGPQQARIQARNEFVREYLRKKYGNN